MRPVSLLILLFISIPLLEIYLLMSVGRVIGLLPTIFVLAFTAVLGAMLVRTQGRNTWLQIQQSMARGELPATEMLEGVLIMFAGALLLTPGFATDTVGFCFLVPAIRRALIATLIRQKLASSSRPPQTKDSSHFGPRASPTTTVDQGSTSRQGRIIEGELDED